MSNEQANVYRSGGVEGETGGASASFTRRVEDQGRLGRSGRPAGRSRLYNYDRVQGLSGAMFQVETDRADRMSDVLARQKMDEIHALFDLRNALESVLYDFDHALFICYALNGASQLVPSERVKFSIVRDGVLSSFDYNQVVDHLGVNSRRFFRAFADSVVDACRRLYDNPGVEGDVSYDLYRSMVQLADHRGISRYPWLIADSAEAALYLDPSQRAAITASKASVIGATTNAVDRRNLAQPIRSADNYDSSVGQSVPRAVDVNASSAAYYG